MVKTHETLAWLIHRAHRLTANKKEFTWPDGLVHTATRSRIRELFLLFEKETICITR